MALGIGCASERVAKARQAKRAESCILFEVEVDVLQKMIVLDDFDLEKKLKG